MKTVFRHNDYIRSHGRAPKGRGCWGFRITGYDGRGGYTTLASEWFAANDTLAGAKRQAKAEARRMASDIGRVREMIIDVLP